MDIKAALKLIGKTESASTVTIDEHIALLDAVSAVQVHVDSLEVVAPEPDDVPDADEPDPLQGEIDGIAKEIAGMSASKIEDVYDRAWFKRAKALFGSNSRKQIDIAQDIIDIIEDGGA